MGVAESSEDGGSSPTRRGRQRTKPRAWAFEEAMDQTGVGRWQLYLTLACGWANASDAVEVLCVSLVLPSIQYEMKVCSWDLGLLTAVVFVGMMLGGYFWGSVGDAVGRRPVMISSLAVNGLFGFLSALMPSFWPFFAMRFLSGVGVGGSIPVIWSYFSEFQPTPIRGRMLSIIATFWMIGQLVFSGIGWALLPHTFIRFAVSSTYIFSVWRIFVALSTLLCFSAAIIVYFLPESPKFLLEKGRKKEALLIMARVYRLNTGNSVSDFPVRRLADTETRALNGQTSKWSILYQQTLSLFSSQLFLTTTLLIFINFTLSFGSYGLTFWLPELFSKTASASIDGTLCQKIANISTAANHSCGIPHPDPNDPFSPLVHPSVYRNTFLVSLSSLPGNLFTIFLLDRIGRKPVFLAGALFSAIAVMGIFFVGTSAEVLLMSCIFNATSVLCWNCLDAFSIELFPTDVRATAMGLGLGFARVGAILGNTLFGLLIDQYCAVPIILVAVMLAAAGLASIRLKETTNVPLD